MADIDKKAIRAFVEKWYEARKKESTLKQFEQELEEYIKNRETALLSRIKEEVIGRSERGNSDGDIVSAYQRESRNSLRHRQILAIDNIAKEIQGTI